MPAGSASKIGYSCDVSRKSAAAAEMPAYRVRKLRDAVEWTVGKNCLGLQADLFLLSFQWWCDSNSSSTSSSWAVGTPWRAVAYCHSSPQSMQSLVKRYFSWWAETIETTGRAILLKLDWKRQNSHVACCTAGKGASVTLSIRQAERLCDMWYCLSSLSFSCQNRELSQSVVFSLRVKAACLLLDSDGHTILHSWWHLLNLQFF